MLRWSESCYPSPSLNLRKGFLLIINNVVAHLPTHFPEFDWIFLLILPSPHSTISTRTLNPLQFKLYSSASEDPLQSTFSSSSAVTHQHGSAAWTERHKINKGCAQRTYKESIKPTQIIENEFLYEK